MASTSRTITRGLGLTCIAGILAAMSIDSLGRGNRLATHPHTQAIVERTWVEYGKGAGRFATVSFPNVQGGEAITCHIDRLRVGSVHDGLAAGQVIEIIPRPNTCRWPDLLNGGMSASSAWMILAVSWVFGLLGLWFLGSGLGLIDRWSEEN